MPDDDARHDLNRLRSNLNSTRRALSDVYLNLVYADQPLAEAESLAVELESLQAESARLQLKINDQHGFTLKQLGQLERLKSQVEEIKEEIRAVRVVKGLAEGSVRGRFRFGRSFDSRGLRGTRIMGAPPAAGFELGHMQILKPVRMGGQSTAHVCVANRVILTPVWVPEDLTLAELNAYCNTASAGRSMRLGVYGSITGENTASTPAGLPLIGGSGNIAAAVGTIRYTPVAALALFRGVNWFAIASEDNVMQFAREFNVLTYFNGGLATMLDGAYYDLGGWGALANPCPAVVGGVWHPHILGYSPAV